MPRMILMIAGLAIVLMSPSLASAQYRSSVSDNPNGPTVSPYLNLLNNNNNIGLPAYQTLVKPLVEQQNAIQRQGNSIQRLQQQVGPGGTRGGGGTTGHMTYFMNYSHYYSRPARTR